MDISQAGGTWPEQNAVDAWLREMGIEVPFADSMRLKEAVTKYRVEQQRRHDRRREGAHRGVGGGHHHGELTVRSNLMARLVAIADERPNVSIGHVVEHELPELRAQAEAMSAQPYLAARVAELEALLRKVEHEYTTQGWLWPTHSVIRAALAKGE